MEIDIVNIIKEFISYLGVSDSEIKVSVSGDRISIDIQTPAERTLMGKGGERFTSIEHLIKRIVAKKFGEEYKVILDVNNNRAKNDELLKTKALIIAQRAREFKTEVVMDPMNSYERMVIHSVLEGSPNIKTESRGEGKNRRLVVFYSEENSIPEEKFI